MSWQSTQAVRDNSKARGVARMVFMVIATHADAHGKGARLSLPTLAQECLLDERQVTRHLNALAKEHANEITISRGLGRGNTYHFDIHVQPNYAPKDAPEEAKTDAQELPEKVTLLVGTAETDTVYQQEETKEKVTLLVNSAQNAQIKGDTFGNSDIPPSPRTPLPPKGEESYDSSPGKVREERLDTPIGNVQDKPALPGAENPADDIAFSGVTSALGYFLAVSKQANGRSATLPNAAAAGSQAKRLAHHAGKEPFQSAVDLFFRDAWYRANYGASWDKFYRNFETILAKATVPPPSPEARSRAAPLSRTEQRRQDGETKVRSMMDNLRAKITPGSEGTETNGCNGSAGQIRESIAGTEPDQEPDRSAGPGRDGLRALRGRVEATANHGADRSDQPRDTPVVQILPDSRRG